MLCGVRIELVVAPYPSSHLLFCVGGIGEVVRPRVDVRQRNYSIRRNLSISQKVFDRPPKLGLLVNSSVTWEEMNVGHLSSQTVSQKLQ